MHGAKPKRDGQGIWRDAKLLEKSMAGLGWGLGTSSLFIGEFRVFVSFSFALPVNNSFLSFVSD